MNKGLKRKLGHCVKEIKEGFQHEETRRTRKTASRDEKASRSMRRNRPFSVLEVFTWTCAISMMAASRGWIAYEPVTLPGWDLMKDSDYKAALDYIDRVSPDLLVVAWPCTKWSRLQTLDWPQQGRSNGSYCDSPMMRWSDNGRGEAEF